MEHKTKMEYTIKDAFGEYRATIREDSIAGRELLHPERRKTLVHFLTNYNKTLSNCSEQITREQNEMLNTAYRNLLEYQTTSPDTHRILSILWQKTQGRLTANETLTDPRTITQLKKLGVDLIKIN